MLKSYSIAEAKNHFTELVHDLETERTIEVTRRGKPVAIMLSVQQYQRLNSKQNDFWDALIGFVPPFADGQIAAVAYVNDLILVTNNEANYQNFLGLQLENWFTS